MKTNVEEETSILLEGLIAWFVDEDYTVSVEKTVNSVRFIVELSSNDLEKLGGARGKTCTSLTAIAKAAGIKAGIDFTLGFQRIATGIPEGAKFLM